MKRNFSAMIMAAGFGTRLSPLTNKIPKPLLKINNKCLLQNNIDFLFKLGCKKIIINTHFKHDLIQKFINETYKDRDNIFISYEKEILDTGGGVKNAIPFFNIDEEILVTNSDIFWTNKNNNDVVKIISDFNDNEKCRLLLIEKNKAKGIINKNGDFILKNQLVKRWKKTDNILYYSGLQILSLKILKDIKVNKFSFNLIWDNLIATNSLYGNIMESNLYHVGDIEGLNIAIKANT